MRVPKGVGAENAWKVTKMGQVEEVQVTEAVWDAASAPAFVQRETL